MKKEKLFFLLAVLFVTCGKTFAQEDTLKLSLKDLEGLFLEKNAVLLAQKYEIAANKAQEIQAKLWDNPTLLYEQMLYNNKTNRILPILGLSDAKGVPPTTQQAVQIQQLFLLANKRTKRLKLAETASKQAENMYYEVLRNLKFELRRNYYDAFSLQQILKVYSEQLASLSKTITGMNVLLEKGIVPQKEVTRLDALRFTLQNEQRDFRNQLQEKQATIRLIANIPNNAFVSPNMSSTALENVDLSKLSIAQIIQKANENRPDLHLQETALVYEQQNLDLQKALKTPDIRLGMLYDRSGSSVPNYFAINAQIDLPVWNKNQGNIKTAEMKIQSAQKMVESQRLQIEREAQIAYSRAIETSSVLKDYDKKFIQNYDQLISNAKTSYEKQIISMLEFLDLYESYKNSTIQMYNLLNDRRNAIEEINYVAGDV